MIGHQKQWKLLKNIVSSGDLNHAYLFSGQEQLGKRSIALEFANLVCPNISYPDLICIEGGSIKDTRDLIWKLSLKPYIAPFKIILIDNAHLMNSESQNCFLKTLEEPKGKSLIILITSYPEMLFKTILSRVQQIRFFPVPKEEIEKYLVKSGQKNADYISLLSLGRPGRAMEFTGNNDRIKQYEEIIVDLKKICGDDLGKRFQYAKNILADEDSNAKLKEILETWLNYFRQMLMDRISEAVKDVSEIFKIKKIINKIQSVYYLVATTNINQKLALEIILMEI